MPKPRLSTAFLKNTPVLKAAGLFALALAVVAPSSTQNAIANGDTRTINLYHMHTKESLSITFLVNGSYDSSALQKLNWFLRDWRRDEPTRMDPRLFDTLWEVYRKAGGGSETINVNSAYRSPETNGMLRRRSRGVAKNSQHMAGKAMDTFMPGMSMSRIREVGMRLQRGGVGYYPTAGHPFVHLDVGSVRHWPKMSYDQLARIFPDGKTVHIPSNGQPLPGYELARAEIEANGGAAPTLVAGKSKGFFASLFGGGDDEDEEVAVPTTRGGRRQVASLGRYPSRGAAPEANSYANVDDDGGRNFFASEAQRQAPPVATAARDLPRGETFMRPADAPVAKPMPIPEPQRAVVASLSPEQQKPLQLQSDAGVLPKINANTFGDLAPQPPRRPVGLGALALADSPVPPVRPTSFASLGTPHNGNKSDAIGNLIGGAGKPAQVAAKPQSIQTAMIPARVDNGNFRSLTGSEPSPRTPSQSVLGPTVTGLRAASRAENATLANAPRADSFSAPRR